MKNKIEKGCRAVIVNSEHSGHVVTVGRSLGVLPDFNKGRVTWEIDRIVISTKGRPVGVMAEDMLQRIDDDYQTTTWDEIAKLGWIPNKETA